MELAKIRSLSDDELLHHEKTSGEQLFRLRFQVSMGQNDGVKKLRQLRKEIAQIKTVSRERELGVRGAHARAGFDSAGGRRKEGQSKEDREVGEAAKASAKEEQPRRAQTASAAKKGAGK